MSSPISTAPILEPQLAEGQDRAYILSKLDILATGQNGAGKTWEMVLEGKGVRREFRFKGFNKCWVCVPLACLEG